MWPGACTLYFLKNEGNTQKEKLKVITTGRRRKEAGFWQTFAGSMCNGSSKEKYM